MTGPFAALAAALLVASQAVAAFPQDTTTLVIVATTDVHGRVMAWDYERDREAPLGLVRAATVVDSLRRAHGPGRVVLVDAGDLIQGNPFGTFFARVGPVAEHPVLDAMNRMGYDAATPGNHEFNFGLPVLQRALGTARFPYVSATIVRTADRQTVLPPFVLLTRAGVRVAIVGATTPGVLVWDGPTVRDRLDFLPIAQAVPPAVREARAAGADLVLLVAHSGLDGRSNYASTAAPPENDVAGAIAGASDIDVAVIGHTHQEIADSTVGRTLVVQPRNWAQSVAVVTLSLARQRGRWTVTSKRGQLVPLARVRPDSALAVALEPAHRAARNWAMRPLGRMAVAMSAERARLEDTPVIDFINWVQMRVSGAELSATAAFNPRGALPAGTVTMADLASIYPYDNTLRAVRVSGAGLRAFLEHSSRYYRGMGPAGPIANDSVPGYNFDMVSGAEYELDLSQPLGRRVTRLAVRGRPVADADSFTIALNNYRAQGGGGYAMLARAPVVYDRDEDIRGLLAAALEGSDSLRPEMFFIRSWSIRGVTPATPPAGPPSRSN